ncbi:toprim domain-containing protein [Streptomyces sp. NBC_01235]|uniref:toprim domain-containing protein n=1 Tax=Streptomyces sp. NBC_01235 TaxID=2903788 RepID=UPI002E166236|nr:toprim domain-containing protein [Streptomyces sp. NBC_01235]
MTTIAYTAIDRLRDILRDLGEPTRMDRGDSFRTRGRCHDGDSPDTVSVRRSDGKVDIHCHKCDGDDQYLTAIGWTVADLYDEPREHNQGTFAAAPRPRPKPSMQKTSRARTKAKRPLRGETASYQYCDENGTPLFEVVRIEIPGQSKDFRQIGADGFYGTPGIRRVLYRLPDVIKVAQAGGYVTLVEGEKDVETLVAVGVTATTMPGGVGMGWTDEYTESLKGAAEVIVVADRDAKGREHAEKVADSLERHGLAYRILESDRAKDITDHFAAGGTLNDLVPVNAPSNCANDQAEIPPTQIQMEFWNSRESLASIRRLAHSRLLPADTTLAAIMARVSGAVPHTFTAKSPMGHASLNLAAAMIGGPSAGKSQSARAARLAFPAPDRLQGRDGLPIGSGEGMTEVFIGLQEQETGEVKKGPGGTETPVTVQVRMQIHHNAFFYVDEGKSIGDLEERGGSTLGETIRRAAMGEALGQTNASQDRKRFVAPMSYAMGVLVGLQPSIASTLLKDAGTGTPQRFLWLWARDVTIPDEVVEHAGVIDVHAINDPSYGGTVVFEVPAQVAADMRAKRLHAVRTGGADTDEINGHEPVMKMKFAALLAIIDGRYHMTMDDWRLAEMLWTTSCAVRDELIGLAAREAIAARRAAEAAEIDLAARKEDALDKAAMRREARLKKVLEHLANAGGRMSRTDLIQKFHSRYRGELPDVIERGVAKGVLRAVEEDGDWWVHAVA